MRRMRQTWGRLFAWAMGAVLLAGCGGGPEGAIRDLALTATAAAPPAAPTSRAAFVATPVASRTGSAVMATTTAGSAVAGATKAGSTATISPTGSVTPGRTASATATVATETGTATGSGPRPLPAASPSPGLFTDAGGRYSFRVPSKWRGQKSTNTAVEIEVVSDTPTAYLRTVSQVTTVPVTLDGATSVIVNSLRKTVSNFEEAPGGTREAMIGGQRAKRVEYFGTDNGTRLRYVTYVIVYNQKLVVSLFFIAQPGDLDEVLIQGSVVLNTFAFT